MKTLPSLRPASALAALVLSTLPAARAASYTWNGGLTAIGQSPTSDIWSLDGNWSTTNAPSSSADTDLSFTHSSPHTTSTQTIGNPFVLHSLTFPAANDNFTTITGNPLNFRNNSAAAGPTLTQSSPTAVAISTPLTLTNDLTVGGDGAGVLTLGGVISGGGALVKTGASTLNLTGVGSSLSVFNVGAGVCVINSGSFTATAYTYVTAGGALGISGTSSFTSNTQVLDGTTASPGTLNINGGACSFGYLQVGNSTVGLVNQSAGTCTLTSSAFGSTLGENAGSSGTYNLADGTLSSTTAFTVGYSGNGVFAQGGGSFTPNSLYLGTQSSGAGTYRLNGGTLAIPRLNVGAGTSNFVFNGGTLRATGDNTMFFQGATSSVVRPGGAVIDSNGHAITVAQTLTHSTLAGNPALDGGLTKLGAGTLTLTGVNSFTGGVMIKAGTVSVPSESNNSTNPLGDRSGPVTLLGGTLVFTGSTVNTARTYNLGTGMLAPASGGTITYFGGAINGGALGAGTHDIRDTSTVNGTRVLGGANVTIGHDQATFNNVLFTGNSTLTLPAGMLTTTGDFTANPLTTLTLAGTANLAGAYLSGAVTVQSTGRLNGTGGTAAPLYLDGSRGVTINAGGQLNAQGGSTVELGGLLTNNGAQTGTLHVNLGGVVQGSGTFGTVSLAAAGVFNATGTITGSLLVASGATVNLSGSGQSLVVQGALTNNGTIRFTSGASLSVTSGAANFVNNGVIDLLSGSASLPAGFTNNGVVLDSSLNRVKSIARAANGSSVTVQIDAYPGHNYKLQRSDSLASGSFADVANVPAQGNAATNSAPVTLTFTDAAPAATKGFYRVQIDS